MILTTDKGQGTNDAAKRPEILAPAGSRPAFLAALAAGADAIYCGLTSYSARMAAKNFTVEDLSRLTRIAHERGTRVYLALNSLVRPHELKEVADIVDDLTRSVRPDALIIQDLSILRIARQVGFSGEIHLSTLANVSFPGAMDLLGTFPEVRRVVLPRELTIDEIKTVADRCPEGLDLEVFVHGALCYAVSGRCYWSSYLGGKSGLRGRCVQPCRRRYRQNDAHERFFSCMDLSIDVLVKVLKTIPQIHTWKIEGRKKGPHYVHYTVTAYRMLRDEGHDPKIKRAALDLLQMGLGRPTTHYAFLPQRPQSPVAGDRETGSGLYLGSVKGPASNPFLSPRIALLANDILRIGYEDDAFHGVLRVKKAVPRNGRFHLRSDKVRPTKGAPVFLIDRREKAIQTAIDELERRFSETPSPPGLGRPATNALKVPRHRRPHTAKPTDLKVYRHLSGRGPGGLLGLWLTADNVAAQKQQGRRRIWWWLPPVIWPSEEETFATLVRELTERGGATFVLNAPWQIALFSGNPDPVLWAGPFCNLTNPLAIEILRDLGFAGAVVSPELGADALDAMPTASALPLGLVCYGNWPLCISRAMAQGVRPDEPFTSPHGEQAWQHRHGSDNWLFPNWPLDLRDKRPQLERAGYRLFVTLMEPVPKSVAMIDRKSHWNWDGGLL